MCPGRDEQVDRRLRGRHVYEKGCDFRLHNEVRLKNAFRRASRTAGAVDAIEIVARKHEVQRLDAVMLDPIREVRAVLARSVKADKMAESRTGRPQFRHGRFKATVEEQR